MDVRFRRMVGGDVQAVGSLEADCFVNPTGYVELRAIARAPESACHVCVLGDELVGHAVAFGRRGIWWLQSVCVEEKYRRSGFGCGLVERTFRDVPDGRLLAALVMERDRRSLEFFADCKFRVLKMLDRPADDGDKMVLMVRRKEK